MVLRTSLLFPSSVDAVDSMPKRTQVGTSHPWQSKKSNARSQELQLTELSTAKQQTRSPLGRRSRAASACTILYCLLSNVQDVTFLSVGPRQVQYLD